MSRQKKRNKAYAGPKYVARNPLVTFFGGMGGQHYEHLQNTLLINHTALSNMARGVGDKEDWERLVGAMNCAIIMTEQGIGPEYEADVVAAREALIACGKRAVKNNHRFIFTGDELKVMNQALDVHDLQLKSVRAIDVDKAAAEVERRLRHRINSTSVMAEIHRDQAEAPA